MPHCPSCRKGSFKDQHAVTMHMSQPTSGCNTWINNLISIQKSVTTKPQTPSLLGDASHNCDTVSNPVSMDLDWKQVSAIIWLRTKHSPLNQHLHQIKHTMTPYCPACPIQEETIKHFLLDFPQYHHKRNILKNKI